MNRKGFAITTVIYGLSVLGVMVVFILMGILSSTRMNVSSEAARVEEELIAYSRSSVVFSENGDFQVPKGESGWYRFEVFGSAAISDDSTVRRGAYVTGIIEAEEGDIFNIVIGNGAIVREGESSVYSGASAVSMDGRVLVSAANGYISDSRKYPGGTLLAQCDPVPGGEIIYPTYTLADNTTFNGNWLW